jgi:hypothetical protein
MKSCHIRVVYKGNAMGRELAGEFAYVSTNDILFDMDQRVEAKCKVDGAVSHHIQCLAVCQRIRDLLVGAESSLALPKRELGEISNYQGRTQVL